MVVPSQQNHKGEVHLLEKIQKTTAMAIVSTCTLDASRVLWKFIIKDSIDASTNVKHTKLQICTFDNLQNSCVTVRPCITILTRTKTKPVFLSFFCMHHKNWPQHENAHFMQRTWARIFCSYVSTYCTSTRAVWWPRRAKMIFFCVVVVRNIRVARSP
jgi:hypothetical protein